MNLTHEYSVKIWIRLLFFPDDDPVVQPQLLILIYPNDWDGNSIRC